MLFVLRVVMRVDSEDLDIFSSLSCFVMKYFIMLFVLRVVMRVDSEDMDIFSSLSCYKSRFRRYGYIQFIVLSLISTE